MAGLFGEHYDTVEDAAAAMLAKIARQPRATEQEYLGFIVKDPDTGKFRRSNLAHSGRAGKVKWEDVKPVLSELAAQGFTVADVLAGGHNHPIPGPDTRFAHDQFSEADVGLAERFGRNFLLAMEQDSPGRSMEFRPERDRITKHRQAGSQISAERRGHGQEFLAKFPIEEELRYLSTRFRLIKEIMDRRRQRQARR